MEGGSLRGLALFLWRRSAVLNFTRRHVHNELGKLGGIARAFAVFRHLPSPLRQLSDLSPIQSIACRSVKKAAHLLGLSFGPCDKHIPSDSRLQVHRTKGWARLIHGRNMTLSRHDA